MKKRFTFLIAAIAAIMMISLPGKAVGQTKDPILLFHETFGNNSGSATAWNATTYSVQSGEEEVYKDAVYTVTNAKVSKNTMGQTASALVSTQGKTGSVIIGPLDVSSYSDIEISYYFGMSSSTWNTTYSFVKLSYLGNNSTYVELTRTDSNGNPTAAVSNNNNHKQAVYSLPEVAISDELYLKFEFYCYQKNKNNQEIGQAYFDEINMTGIEATPTTYAVTFDCGEGSEGCPEDMTDIEPGENNFTVPSALPTKACYTCTGYKDANNNTYTAGTTYTISSSLTLTAQWTLNKYTVTYYSNNGETGEDVAVNNLECGSAYTIADDPGFTQPQATPNFVNWNTQPDGNGTTYSVGQGITISGNLSLYAQWSAVATYTVTYAPGTGATGSNVVDNNVSGSYTVRANDGENGNPAFSKEGYTFKCWNNGSSDVNAGSNITVSSNVTLTAQWLENLANPTFTVTGVSNGTANTYYVTANIEIEQEDGAYVYYTTDGSDPTDESTEYTEAFSVTNSCTIKAIAIFEGYADSEIVSQEIIIVQPNEAEFTNGVYESLDTQNDYNKWYKYSVSGDQVWSWSSYQSTYYAKMSGYSGGNKANEDWLISPKMTVINGKLAVSFDCAAKYGSNALCSAQYSTNYPGYGDPSDYTWTQIKTLPYDNNFTFTAQNMTITCIASDVYVAIKYVSTTSEASTIEINNFSAKQCYPITYYANYENPTGSTADANSPYAVGAEVTILDCGFDAPDNTQEFTSWNTKADGSGYTKNPGQTIEMTTDGYELYAIWGEKCTLAATMNVTTGEAVYDYNSGNKRFNINLSSSVKTLGGCDIYDYGFVYRTTEGNPTIADTKVVVGDTQPAVATAFNTTIENVTTGATYYVRSYATNAAGTAYSDPISVTVPAAFPTWTISYTTNGTTDGSTTVEQGDKISGLKAAPTADYVPSGYTFMGWYGDDYALNNTAPIFVKNGDDISGNITLRAVFAIQTGNSPATLTKMGKGDNFAANDKVVIVAVDEVLEKTTNYYGMYQETQSSSYVKNFTFTESAENVAANNKNWWTVTSGTNGKWKLGDGTNGYLYTSGSNNLSADTENSTEWTLEDNKDGTFGLKGGGSNRYVSCRTDLSGTNQYLFRLAGATPAGVYALNIYKYVAGNTTYSSYCTAVEILSGNISGNKTGACAIHPTLGATIKSGTTLTAGALGNTNAAKLVIEDGGQLNCPNAVEATIKKNIDEAWDPENKTGWYTISTPTSSTSFDDVSNLKPMDGDNRLYDIYRYKESTMIWENSIQADFDDDDFEEGRGYLYRKGNTTAISFTGMINANESYEQSLSVTGATAIAGFALLGNPYSHNINLKHVTVDAGNNLDACYILSGEGAWGASIGNTADIAPCTGFLVQATADCKATIHKSQARNSKANADYIQFIVANNQYEDVTFALFDEGHGLNKINHRNSNIQQIYIPKDGESFAVATMADNTQSFNLNFKAMTMGQYKLSFKAKGEFNYLHVIDRMTGEDIDMLLEGEYSFIGSPQDNEARFIVRLGYLPNYDNNGSDIFAYQNGSDVIVSGEGELQIFDVMGRMVSTQNVSGTEIISVNAQGVYVLRLVGTDIKTQKIVVR